MLKLTRINKIFGIFSLKDVSFEVSKGEYFILLGPSGAGKSVVLELIAGLVTPDSGKIELKGDQIVEKRIQDRKVGLVFQDLALFPHLSVKQNIAYPLLRKGLSKLEISKKVVEISESLSITHLLGRSPKTLSGGEQQRVALARTLVLNPDLLLLDEPLSSLDVELKVEIRRLLRSLNRAGQTIIHVTHDYEEAIALGQKIAVMNNGMIEQIGSPQEVFSMPVSSFVAKFGGVRNFFKVNVIKSKEEGVLEATSEEGVKFYLFGDREGEGYITFPESTVSLSVKSFETSSKNIFEGKVIDFYPQRFGVEVVIDVGVKIYSLITNESVHKFNITIGSTLWLSFKASSVVFIRKD